MSSEQFAGLDRVPDNTISDADKQRHIQSLFEEGASARFDIIAQSLPDHMDEDFKKKVQDATIGQIFYCLESGHFGDLYGADILLKKLGIKDLQISPGSLEKLSSIADRLSEHQILPGLVAPGYIGAVDEEPSEEQQRADHLAKARRTLEEAGFTNEELDNDQDVWDIIKMRHVLYALKEKDSEDAHNVKKLFGADRAIAEKSEQ